MARIDEHPGTLDASDDDPEELQKLAAIDLVPRINDITAAIKDVADTDPSPVILKSNH
ncbi:hypothetical protein N9L31_00100 [bacterium]|nr:hypothetical protein [bacterium]